MLEKRGKPCYNYVNFYPEGGQVSMEWLPAAIEWLATALLILFVIIPGIAAVIMIIYVIVAVIRSLKE